MKYVGFYEKVFVIPPQDSLEAEFGSNAMAMITGFKLVFNLSIICLFENPVIFQRVLLPFLWDG